MDLRGFQIVLDLDESLSKQKKLLSDQIRSVGASISYVVTKQTKFVLTTEATAKNAGFRIREAVRLGVPLLHPSFLAAYLEGDVTNMSPWIIAPPKSAITSSLPSVTFSPLELPVHEVESVTESIKIVLEPQFPEAFRVVARDLFTLLTAQSNTTVLPAEKKAPAPVVPRDEPIPSGLSAKAELLLWVARRILQYRVRDFMGAFQDGKALLALVEACSPGLVNLSDTETWTPLERVKRALELAESGLSIPPIIDAEDIVNAVDELSTMTYISYFRDYVEQHHKKGSTAASLPVVAVSPPEAHKTITTTQVRYLELHASASGSETLFRVAEYDGSVEQPTAKRHCGADDLMSPNAAMRLFANKCQELTLKGWERKPCDIKTGDEASKLSPAVQDLVALLHAEMQRSLIDAGLSTISGDLTQSALASAEGVLLQIEDKLGTAKEVELKDLTETYASHLCLPKAGKVIASKEAVAEKREFIQALRDMMGMGEILSGASQSIDRKYASLRCAIRVVTDEPELKPVLELFAQSSPSHEVTRVFALSRVAESSSFTHHLPNQRLLCHGSHARNYAGLLSRGFLLPRVAYERLGIKRSDYGMLGAGIYFAPSASTSLKYASPTPDGRQFVLVSRVALGSTYHTRKIMPSLHSPPESYHSTHGVPADVSPSDFVTEEFVVYNPTQIQIKYLVECRPIGQAIEKSNLGPLGKAQITWAPPPPPKELPPDAILSAPPASASEVVGLVASTGALVPLDRMSVRGKIIDMIAEVHVFQRFRNLGDTPLEAKYHFPVDELAAVCGFEAFIGEKHLVAKLKEKEQAQREYREAVEKGHGAYLLDEDAPELFTLSLGNIPAKTAVVLKISFVTELQIEGGALKFSLSPRVSRMLRNALSSKPTQVTTTSVASETVSDAFVDILLGVDCSRRIISIDSDTVLMRKQTESHATVRALTDMKQDFSMLVKVEELNQPRLWLEKSDKGTIAAFFSMSPIFDMPPSVTKEVILLIDRSESMRSQVALLRKVLHTCLTELARKRALQVIFNVIGFGSAFHRLFPQSLPCTEENLRAAHEYVSDLEKTWLGGTELWRALDSLYLLCESNPTVRPSFVLLSDALVGEPDSTLSLIRKHSDRAQLHVIGIGDNTDKYTARSLGRAGGGSTELINTWGPKNNEKVGSLFERVFQESFDSISIAWTAAGNITQSPAQISAVYEGSPLCVYALGIENCISATLVCRKGTALYTTVASCNDSLMTKGDLVHRLAVKSMLHQHQEGFYSDDEAQDAILKKKKLAELRELSLKYQIASPWTSFVAIEERKTGENLRKEPPPLTHLASLLNTDALPYLSFIVPTEVEALVAKQQEKEDEDQAALDKVLQAERETAEAERRAQEEEKRRDDEHQKREAERERRRKAGEARITVCVEGRGVSLNTHVSIPIVSLINSLREKHSSVLPAFLSHSSPVATPTILRDYALFQSYPAKWLIEHNRSLEEYGFQPGYWLDLKTRTIMLTIELPSGGQKEVKLDQTIPVEQLHASLAEQVGIRGKKLSLSHKVVDKSRSYGSEWLTPTQSLAEQGIGAGTVVAMKKKFFCTDANIDRNDPVQLHLLYTQMRDNSGVGQAPAPTTAEKGRPKSRSTTASAGPVKPQVLSKDEAVALAALNLQIERGSQSGAPPLTKDALIESLPPAHRTAEAVAAVDLMPSCRKQLKQMTGMSSENAKYRYVQMMRSTKNYGITTYEVALKDARSKKLKKANLGITKDGITMFDPETGEATKSWPLTQIRRWAASEKSFTLDFGDYESDYVTVASTEGESMSQLIGGYIDIILKCKKDAGRIEAEDDSTVAVEEAIVGPIKATQITTTEGLQPSGKAGKKKESASVSKFAVSQAGPSSVEHRVHVDFNSSSEATEIARQSGLTENDVTPAQAEALMRAFQGSTSKKLKEQLQKRNTVVGTPYWLAPEVLADGVASSPLPKVPELASRISEIKSQTAPIIMNVSKIGEGAMGSVYKGELDGRPVAIKRMQTTDDAWDELISHRELNLSHPGLITTLAITEKKGELSVIAEYVDGCISDILDHYEQDARLDESMIAYVMREVLSALAYLHARNLMHNEVKADNVMFLNDGRILLTTSSIAGAPAGAEKTDIWSAGVLMYELVDGEPAYMDIHPMRALFMISKNGLPPMQKMSECSLELVAFVSRCTERDPACRPSAEELLKHPFLTKACNAGHFTAAIRRAAQARNGEVLELLPDLSYSIPTSATIPINEVDDDTTSRRWVSSELAPHKAIQSVIAVLRRAVAADLRSPVPAAAAGTALATASEALKKSATVMPRHARLPSLVRALREQLSASGDSIDAFSLRTSTLGLVDALRSLVQWLAQKTPVHSQSVCMLLFPLEQLTETRVPVVKAISEVSSLLKELMRCANEKKASEVSEYKAKLIAELTSLESKLVAAFKAAFDSLSAALTASCAALIALLKNAAQHGQTYSYSDRVSQHIAELRQGCDDMLSLFEM